MLGRNRKSAAVRATVPAPPAMPAVADRTPAEQAAEVEARLNAARVDLATSQKALSDAQVSYDEAIGAASITAALDARTRIAEREVAVDIARQHVERLTAELTPLLQGAADAAAAAERDRLRMDAEAKIEAYRVAVLDHYPTIITLGRMLVRLEAEAELAREKAADAGVALPRADSFRDQSGRPREELGQREVDLWLSPYDGQPWDADRQRRVKLQSDGSGSLASSTHTSRATRKQRFLESTYQPAVRGEVAPSLSKLMVLPAAAAGEPAGYTPPTGWHDARAVLARLDELERAQAKPLAVPPVKTERKPIEFAREVAVKREPAVAKLVRNCVGSI